MPNYKIGTTNVDLLNKQELHEGLSYQQENWFREMARGVKYMRTPTAIGTPASGRITLPLPGETIGPKAGFTWAVQRLTVSGLTTGDTVQIYRNTANPSNLIAQVTFATPFIFFGEKGFILTDNDILIVDGATTSTGQVIFNGEYIECPTVDVWKIIGGS